MATSIIIMPRLAFLSSFIHLTQRHHIPSTPLLHSLNSARPICRPLRRSRRHEPLKMVKTYSTMLPLGTSLPPFSLPEPLTNNTVTQDDVKLEHGLLVVFICNHCPFVVHLHNQLKALGKDLPEMGIGMVGIASSDVQAFPQDGFDAIKEHAQGVFSTFKYLFDETQEVAKAFHAACTPDVFLFDKDLKLVYRGQVDKSRPGNGKPTNGSSIREAAQLLVDGKPIAEDMMIPSIGCNIKWKPGNEPDYFG